ncbi:MAG: hypothetical protein HOW73_43735 [Polyangiaceae bacterium]|nr:hypothetical protein [Polyangiaceae bacterium]
MTIKRLRIGALIVAVALATSCGDKNKKKSTDDGEEVRATKEETPAPKKDDDGKVRFTVKPSAAGDRFEHGSSGESGGEIKINAAVIPLKNVDKKRYTVEVLAVEDGRTVKQKVRYVEFEEKDEPPSKKAKKAPVVGKVYVIERKVDSLEITDEAGAAVTGLELDYLKDGYKRLGKPKKFPEALAKAALVVGEDAPELGAAFAEDQHDPGDAFEVKSMRLKERDGDIARFEYVMEGTSAELEGAKLKVNGTLEVSISTGDKVKDGGTMTIEASDAKSGVTLKLSGKAEDTTKRL